MKETHLLELLTSLNQISEAINHTGPGDADNGDVSLQLIAESVLRVVPGAAVIIYSYDEAAGSFDAEARASAQAEGQVPSEAASQPDELGLRAIQRRQRMFSYEELDLDVQPAHATGCLPLIVAEQVVGLLHVSLHEKREFTQLEKTLLANFANQAAMAIYHTRRLTGVHQDLVRKEAELSRLHRAGLIISSRLRLKETLESILQLALEVTDARYGIFRLLDKSGEFLITSAVRGSHMDRPLIEKMPLNGNSVMAHVARTRQPALISDLRVEPWAHIYYPLDSNLKMLSELAVPLVNASGRLEGVLILESPQVGAFTKDDSLTFCNLSQRMPSPRSRKCAYWMPCRLGSSNPDTWPARRGFDSFCGFLEGTSDYFKPGDLHRGNTRVDPAGERYYTTDAFTDESIQFLRDHQATNSSAPFFVYLAYNAPHFPMKAMPEDYRKYRGRFKAGWDVLRERVVARQKQMGLLPPNTALAPRPGESHRLGSRGGPVPAWNSLSPEQQDAMDAIMATYAAMVDRVDQNVGKLTACLREIGNLDNTLIFFLSDNGAEAESPPLGDFQIENLGHYGKGGKKNGRSWATFSNTPFREYKHFTLFRRPFCHPARRLEHRSSPGERRNRAQEPERRSGIPDRNGEFRGLERASPPLNDESRRCRTDQDTELVQAVCHAGGVVTVRGTRNMRLSVGKGGTDQSPVRDAFLAGHAHSAAHRAGGLDFPDHALS